MVQEARRMSSVVNDLLDAARGDQIGFVGEVTHVDLHTLVAEVIAGLPEGRAVRLDATPVTVPVDANRIRQVVNNLLDNAIKYSPNGGEIDVRVSSEDGAVSLVVVDPGIGIAEEDIPVIFDRFGRAAAVQHRSMTGLGLGLYFCKRIVEEHGGEITVQSKIGAGSEFRVKLPLTPKGPSPQPSEART
jgi:signal transduction histidine kinase